MKRIDFLSVVHKFDFLIDMFHYKQDKQDKQDKTRMATVVDVSLGSPNGQKANAPEGSGRQSDIILHMSDGTQLKSGSGWVIRMEESPGKIIWRHLGGVRGKRQSTVYRLRDTPTSSGGWWTKDVDQSLALSLYGEFGKQ